MDLADVLEQTEKRLSSASAVRAMPEGQSLKVNSTYIENRTIYIHAFSGLSRRPATIIAEHVSSPQPFQQDELAEIETCKDEACHPLIQFAP